MRRLAAALVTLAVLPATADAATHPCWPEGSRTLARSEHARVFVDRAGEQRYGCLYSRGRPVRLDSEQTDDLDLRSDAQRPFVFAGRHLAFPRFIHERDGVEGSTHVMTVDLRSGRERFDHMFEGVVDVPEVPDDFRLILRRTGGIAWIATGHDLQTDRAVTQVLRSDSRGPRLLAQDDSLTDLKFCDGARACWKQGGVTRKASLR
jgi:hypothetical protein